MKKPKSYVLFSLAALAVGGLASLLTADALKNVYPMLRKSLLNPPGAVFPVVWTLLYILMGVGMARVYDRTKRPAKALAIWGAQLAANFAWTLIFFNLRNDFLAFAWLIGLIGLILAMISVFSETDKTAAFLQIPYLLWSGFAAYLTWSVWMLNS